MKIPQINIFQNNLNTKRLYSTNTVSIRGNFKFDSENSVDEIDEFEKSYSPLNVYLSSISKFERISKEEEVLLAKKIQQGGEEAEQAADKLIKANLMLVVNRAKKRHIATRRMDIMDYIQEGNIGLAAAVDKYDGSSAFSSLAVPYIDGYMKRAEIDKGTFIRIPSYLVSLINTVFSAQSDLQAKLKRKPTNEEIAQQTNLSISQVERCKSARRHATSLQQIIGDNTELMNLCENKNAPSPKKNIEKEERDQYIRKLLGNLTERTQQILILKFGLFGNEPLSETELADMFGITKQRVSSIIKRSIKKLQYKSPDIKEYL